MAHEIAKLLLEHAETFLDRTEAIETALSLGMPLNEIESYLDWLDQTQDSRKSAKISENPPPPNQPKEGENNP
jgi:DNA-binding transcriptional MerR regulator